MSEPIDFPALNRKVLFAAVEFVDRAEAKFKETGYVEPECTALRAAVADIRAAALLHVVSQGVAGG